MNLYLMGYRGSGKTTVARLLGQRLGRVVIDTDQCVVDEAQMPISQIFSQFGAADFRRRESEAIAKFDQSANAIVALGGGAVLAEANRQWMKANGKTVWLTAPPEVLWQRIRDDENSAQSRPDLTDLGGLAEVQQVLASRMTVYAESADFIIAVEELVPAEVADQVVQWWESVDK